MTEIENAYNMAYIQSIRHNSRVSSVNQDILETMNDLGYVLIREDGPNVPSNYKRVS